MKILFSITVPSSFLYRFAGQAPFPNKDEIKQFSGSKTCVVLEDDPFSAFNAYIKDAMKQYWKMTPYEFIDAKEFNVRRLKPALFISLSLRRPILKMIRQIRFLIS